MQWHAMTMSRSDRCIYINNFCARVDRIFFILGGKKIKGWKEVWNLLLVVGGWGNDTRAGVSLSDTFDKIQVIPDGSNIWWKNAAKCEN